MAITSVWNGSYYELFFAQAAAQDAAENLRESWLAEGHPMGECPAPHLVSAGAPPYWFRPAYVRDGVFIGASEAPGVSPGDDSEEVHAAIAAWWAARDAAYAQVA